MKSENYITILGWMRTELELKGNELLLYALIYGFSQDNDSKFTGSQNYLANWLGVSRSTVNLLLNSLKDKGLLYKEDYTINSVKLCSYKIVHPVRKSDTPLSENKTLPCPKIGHNNTIDITKINIKGWKDDFEVYLYELRQVYKELISDKEWLNQQKKYHPGVDIILSVQKACSNFWATEAGWRHKKKQRTQDNNWKLTLTNAIDMNKVYIPKDKQESISQKYVLPKEFEGYGKK